MTPNYDFTEDTFRAAFPSLEPIIRREWPSVDKKRLRESGGDLDVCAAVIAAETPATKKQVVKQLEELHRLAASDFVSEDVSSMKTRLYRIESKTNEIATRMRNETLPAMRSSVRNNLLLSIATSIGLGFVVGFVMRGFMRRAWQAPVSRIQRLVPWLG